MKKTSKSTFMRIYQDINVYEKALDRIRWLYDEFETVATNISGGKDSTVVLELMIKVAKEKNRLPVKVLFLDQEAEWQGTIDQVKYSMERKEVEPYWFQIPFLIQNGTSTIDWWLKCWDKEHKDKWMYPYQDYSYKENIYGSDRFYEIMDLIYEKEWGSNLAILGGVRTEESPVRKMGLCYQETYKGETWGAIRNKNKGIYSFYPIYDWTFHDIWKAIFDNNWRYNKVYDAQYRYGVPFPNMRISNLTHETAIKNIFYAQEIEPKTYEKLTQRLGGIDMAAKLNKDYFISDLPYMFKSWTEYRDYLLDKLINEEYSKHFVKMFMDNERVFGEIFAENPSIELKCRKAEVSCILSNDWEGTKMRNFRREPTLIRYKRQETERKANELRQTPSQ